MSAPPLIWVTEGKTQHPALLIQHDPSHHHVLVEWTTTRRREWVKGDRVHAELSPRHSRHRVSADGVLPPPSPEKVPFRKRARSPPRKTSTAGHEESSTYCSIAVCGKEAQAKFAFSSLSSETEGRQVTGAGPATQSKNNRSSRTTSIELEVSVDSDDLSLANMLPSSNILRVDLTNSIHENGDDSDDLLLVDLVGKPERHDYNVDDDDDVEVLLTIRPPSPLSSRPRPVSKSPLHSTFNNDIDARPLSKRARSSVEGDILTDDDAKPFAMKLPVELEKPAKLDPVNDLCSDALGFKLESAAMLVDDAAGEPKRYALRTSAYLQNLAEICHAVTQDRRWRFGGATMQALFQWEHGDDLSVVTALGRLFVPRPPPLLNVECTCLLCRDEKTAVSDLSVSCVSVSSQPEELPVPEIKDNAEVRMLYLYSRLFYRKGPWFRLDDVYSKYYVPKVDEVPIEGISDTPTISSSHGAPKTVGGALEHKPLLCRTAVDVATAAMEMANCSTMVDTDLLKKHLDEYVPRLLADIQRLYGSGMIRLFNDEIECGKTVGVALLTAEERCALLSKLGAGKKRKLAPGAKRGAKVNEVWRQMSLQQSIVISRSNNKILNVLPVRCHVEALIMEKFAYAVVQACSRVDYIPAAEMREHTLAVKSSIQTLIKKQSADLMCFRLREIPALTLQRCVRLYLCALSGPGEMRGCGTNGWRSIRSLGEANIKNAPLGTAMPPPGQHTWHHVQYPGLSHVFGLSSASYINAYTPLLVGDDNQDVQHLSEQVFVSIEAFRYWELCAELRANVDYLLELNEALRYDERRRAKGKAPRHTSGDSNGHGSVDCMLLLTETGRDVLLRELLLGTGNAAETRANIERDIKEALPALESQCEKILSTIGILALHVLLVHSKSMRVEEHRAISDRPWIRHLSWHACLAYLLYDVM